jgi:hypothetical protein
MNAVNTLLFAVALATGLAGLVVWALRRSFLRLLVELCGNEVRGAFWYVLSSIGIVLLTLLGALLAFAPGEFANWKETVALDASLGIFRAGVIGLVCSISLVGLTAFVSIVARISDARPIPPSFPPRSNG